MTNAASFEWIFGDDGVELRFPFGRGTKRDVAILKSRLLYRLASGEEHGADLGMYTDGTSMPPLLWWHFGHPFDSAHCRESIVHDSDYQKASPTEGTVIKAMRSPQRAKADAAFRQALHANPKLSAAEAEAIYRGVRLFGWWAWRRHARNNALVAKGVSNG